MNLLKLTSLLILILFEPAFAEEAVTVNFTPLQKKFALRPFIDIPTYSFYLGAPNLNGYAFVPNYAPRLGFAFKWGASEIAASLSLPIPSEEINRRGVSEQQSWVFHSSYNSYLWDFYYQKYRGLYAGNPFEEISTSKADRYTQYPEAEVQNIGANIYLFDNLSQYDPRSVFELNQIPLKDGGQWFKTVFFNNLKLNMGQKVVKGSDPDAISQLPKIHILDITGAGMTWGYGYTWLLPYPELFLLAQASFGPALQLQFREEYTSGDSHGAGLGLKANFKAALMKNNQENYYGLRFFMDTTYSRVGELDVYSTVLTAQALYGVRF